MPRLRLLLPTLLATAALSLAGCSVADSTHTNPLQANPLPAGNYANWHIQVGSTITAAAPVFLTGPMQISGSTMIAQFESTAPCSTTTPRDFSGTFDATTGVLYFTTSATPGIEGTFTLGTPLTSPSTGILGGGAIPDGGSGSTCLLVIGNAPSIALEIPTLTGAYSGTLTGPSTSTSAVAQLTLTQSTTPNSSAGFPLAATLNLAQGSCSASYSLSGQISGAVYSLTGATATNPTVSGLDSNAGLTLPNVTITLPADPCGGGATTFVGTLTP